MRGRDGVAALGRPRVLFDVREAADYLTARAGCRWSPQAVRRAWEIGRLPGRRRGSVLVFRASDLDRVLASHPTAPAPPEADRGPSARHGERRDRVRAMHAAGHSCPAIAAAVGATARQVRHTLRASQLHHARPRPVDRRESERS